MISNEDYLPFSPVTCATKLIPKIVHWGRVISLLVTGQRVWSGNIWGTFSERSRDKDILCALWHQLFFHSLPSSVLVEIKDESHLTRMTCMCRVTFTRLVLKLRAPSGRTILDGFTRTVWSSSQFLNVTYISVQGDIKLKDAQQSKVGKTFFLAKNMYIRTWLEWGLLTISSCGVCPQIYSQEVLYDQDGLLIWFELGIIYRFP